MVIHAESLRLRKVMYTLRRQNKIGECGALSVTSVPVGTFTPVRPRNGGAACNLDLDGDGLLPATDALVSTRYLLGFRNAARAQGITLDACVTNTTASRLNTAAAALAADSPLFLDIDGDGVAQGSTESLLLVRSLLGLTGTVTVAPPSDGYSARN